MYRKSSSDQGTVSVRTIGPTVWRPLALFIALVFVLATTVSAADGRTVLKPGWNMFSPQQDVEIGQQVSADAERELPMLNNSRVDNYVNSLGRKLSAKAPGEKYPYEFKVVNDRTINAFALPGGPIYINRGVIENADNEAQLAGVIAHEISHVALRHGTNQASKASAAQVPLAILGGLLGSSSTKAALAQLGASFAVNSILLKYSRSAESQADMMGTQILFDTGYDPRAMSQFFQKIEEQQQGSGPAEFFSNHPSPDNRIELSNREVAALGGVPRNATTSARAFDDIKRYVQSLSAPANQPARTTGQSGTTELVIVSATYGAGNGSMDVRQRIQTRVQNDRLDLQVNNTSMGGDPAVDQLKTLQVRYRWDNNIHDVTVRENQRLSLPTAQQISDTRGDSGSDAAADPRSERFVAVENSLLVMTRPDSWQAYGEGDAMSITPAHGLIDDGQGNQSLAYGVIVNVFEPRYGYGQQLQGTGNQRTAQTAAARLDQSSDQLVQELRLSNRNMRVIRYGEVLRVDGDRALSTFLSNDSPLGGRETNWLVTVEHQEGLLFLIFTAPERDFQRYEGAFHEMLRSVRIKR